MAPSDGILRKFGSLERHFQVCILQTRCACQLEQPHMSAKSKARKTKNATPVRRVGRAAEDRRDARNEKISFVESREQAQDHNERKRKKGRSDFHRYPPRPSCTRQDSLSGYRSSPLSIQSQATATFAGRSRVKRLL